MASIGERSSLSNWARANAPAEAASSPTRGAIATARCIGLDRTRRNAGAPVVAHSDATTPDPAHDRPDRLAGSARRLVRGDPRRPHRHVRRSGAVRLDERRASSVSAVVGRPGGGTLVTVSAATPLATQCDGSAGRSFRPALPFGELDGAAGSTSRSRTRPALARRFRSRSPASKRAAAGSADGCTCATCRSRPARRSRTAAHSAHRGHVGGLRQPCRDCVTRPTVTVTSTIAGIPFHADVVPRAFAVDVRLRMERLR